MRRTMLLSSPVIARIESTAPFVRSGCFTAAVRIVLMSRTPFVERALGTSGVGWHRKQEWLGSHFSDASPGPIESPRGAK